MPNEYSLSDLAKLSGVTPRTVRYYIEQGLLPAPSGLGSKATYNDTHLDLLRVIRRLQGAHLPLAEIRRQLRLVPEDELAELADIAPAKATSESALDYIHDLLSPRLPAPAVALPSPAIPTPAMAAPPLPTPASQPSAAQPEPERAQWERVVLDPDIELHIRRPLTRQQNKRIERLISIARQLLEED